MSTRKLSWPTKIHFQQAFTNLMWFQSTVQRYLCYLHDTFKWDSYLELITSKSVFNWYTNQSRNHRIIQPLRLRKDLQDLVQPANVIVPSAFSDSIRTILWKYPSYMPTREGHNYILKWAYIHTAFVYTLLV